MSRTLVSIATYNEAENVEELVRQILAQLPEAEILITDDASPDGTGRIADELARKNPKIHVLHRAEKLGLGTAFLLAFKYAIKEGFDYVITLDADFSHDPKYLPEMAALLRDHEFVTGSRWMQGAKCEYGFLRTVLSVGANTLARLLLGLDLHETTTCYRGFSVEMLKRMDLDAIRSEGYSFAVEVVYYVTRITRKYTEFPIHFKDRVAGTSKISKVEVYKGIFTLFKLFFDRLFFHKKFCDKPLDAAGEPVACCNCKSRFNRELFPRKGMDLSGKVDRGDVFRCTSRQHDSRGRILKCLKCGLVFIESSFSNEEIGKIYSEVEDPLYVENIPARIVTYEYNLDKIKPYMPAGGTLLDVGSYCGVFLDVAGKSGFEAYGVEPSRWAARYAREVLKQNVVAGTLENNPFSGMSFDIITLWDVLEHMPDPVGELALIGSRLKTGGVFCFSTLMIDNWYARLMGRRWPWLIDMHLTYFTQRTIRQLLNKVGFELVHARNYRHCITIEYFFYKLDCLGVLGAGMCRKIVRNLPLGRWVIPFAFGDIQLLVCRKTGRS